MHHGASYQLLKNSTLCLFPSCVKSLILFHTSKGQLASFIAIINSVNAYDDYVAHIIEQLLIEEEEGKLPIINSRFLFYKTANFVRDHLLKKAAEDTLDEVQDTISDASINPEDIFFAKELLENISNTFGEYWALYFIGELTYTDLLKAQPLGLVQFKEKINHIRVWTKRYLLGEI